MSFTIHGTPLAPGHCEVHPDVPEPYPCTECRAEDTQPGPTEWPIEEECAYRGHEYHGDHKGRGRCYCGKVTYPEEGPA